MLITEIRHRIKRTLVNLSLLLVTSVCALLLLEFLVRQLWPTYDPSDRIHFPCHDGVNLAPKNARLRYWTNTGDFNVAVQINGDGFRDRKDLRHADGDSIFVVGDSFSLGHGVRASERYSNLLEQALDRAVYNISIPADFDGYFWLLDYAQKLGARIDTLVVGVCMENDLLFYGPEPRRCQSFSTTKTLRRWIMIPSTISLTEFKLLLTIHSATYALVTSLIQQHDALRRLGVNAGLIFKNEQFSGPRIYDRALLTNSADRLVRLVEPYNAVILIIPSRGLWQGDRRTDESRIHDDFVRMLRSRDLSVIDLRPRFELKASPLDYHFPLDGHWNPRGHVLAARSLIEFFAKTQDRAVRGTDLGRAVNR